MSKQRPILFSGPMVRALLDGTKTQTRRKVNFGNWAPWMPEKAADQWQVKDNTVYDGNGVECGTLKCPYGQVGDILWVRETLYYDDHTPCWGYQADNEELHCEYVGILEKTYKVAIPSIHMPYIACRLFLEIKTIRVERLQDIPESDAIAEGLERWASPLHPNTWEYLDYDDPKNSRQGGIGFVQPVTSYMTLWECIHGRGSWKQNPYVWVIEYKVIDKPVLAGKEVANG